MSALVTLTIAFAAAAIGALTGTVLERRREGAEKAAQAAQNQALKHARAEQLGRLVEAVQGAAAIREKRAEELLRLRLAGEPTKEDIEDLIADSMKELQ